MSTYFKDGKSKSRRRKEYKIISNTLKSVDTSVITAATSTTVTSAGTGIGLTVKQM